MRVWHIGYQGYFGTSKLYKEYAEEEYEHAEWAYKYLKI